MFVSVCPSFVCYYVDSDNREGACVEYQNGVCCMLFLSRVKFGENNLFKTCGIIRAHFLAHLEVLCQFYVYGFVVL